MGSALLLIDLQRDFMAGGTLAVPDADALIPIINDLQLQFDFIVATQDWHPANHSCFAANQPPHKVFDVIEFNGISQVLWPEHCVQQSIGATFAPGLSTDRWRDIIQKGTNPLIDSYSGFYDNAKIHATVLHELLQTNHITHLTLAGVATDYCVKYTALDAIALGYHVSLSLNACRGVNLQTTDSDRAILEMKAAGVIIE